MSENTNTNATEANGSEGRTRIEDTVYPTLEAAKAVKPENEKHRIFLIRKNGEVVGYRWCGDVGNAILAVARRDNYSAELAEKKHGGPLTKDRIASALAAMTDEDRAALIAQYVPAAKGTKGGKK